ncbi:hypothetical protein [Streptomyces sp. TR06-5]|uniref:hypothetical protein n=1 Tax=Streptomyces sp. TR06-5 TaxID=3385976 RepID=UPI00399F46AE
MTHQEVPPHPTAFGHPETRVAWERTRNRIRLRFCLWTVVFVALLALSSIMNAAASVEYARGGSNQLAPMIGALAVLWYPFALYSCLRALSRLKKARRVLEAFPWQPLSRVRKSGRDSEGFSIHLPLGAALSGPDQEENGTVSPTMVARDPRRWTRWDERVERGAWFAGDPSRWGVLAVPGGTGLMTVQRSRANLSADRTDATRDLRAVLDAAPVRG